MRSVFRKTVFCLALLMALMACAAGAQAASLKGSGNPEIVLEVSTHFATLNQEITFSYEAKKIGCLEDPYVQWKIYKWKDGTSELVNYALPWTDMEGHCILGTSGEESFTMDDRDADAMMIETLLVDEHTVVCSERDFVFLGKEPKAVKGLECNGTAQALVKKGKVENGTIWYAVTSKNKKPSSDQYSSEIPTGTDAGTYYVWYMVNYGYYSGLAQSSVKVVIAAEPVGEVTVSGGVYRLDHQKLTAELIRPSDPDAKKLSIPAKVSANDRKYKVTAVGAQACKGMKKLTTLSVGSNVATIGAGAFEDCGKLKTVTINSAKMKKSGFGSGCFRNINAKAVFKVPAKALKDYKKWIINKGGAPEKVKVKGK